MSFGWSAGDIVAALKLLYQISSAVRDSGGASSDFQDTLSFLQTLSQTLQHLNALQAPYLDPVLADNLRLQCNHIRVPLTNFLDDVRRKFGPALGTNSRRKKAFAVPRMIQWTVSDSKKTKRLQDRIAVPLAAVGLILGQQVIRTTLAMPENIQDRISHLIDTKIIPATTHINNNIATLSVGQSSSADTIKRNLHEIGRTTVEAIHAKALEGRNATARMEGHLKRVLISQEASAETNLETNAGLHAKLEDISITQTTSTDLVVRCTKQAGEATADAIRRHALETRAQFSSLHRKLVEVGTSMGAIQDALQTISASRLSLDSDLPKTEVERAIQDIFGGICLLLSSLQNSIRELVMLLAPYLLAFCRIKVQGFLQYGDHFMFEDAIGRIKSLPCAQFQYWHVFYDFLLDSFKDSPGLSLVLDERFRVMNRYNNYPITREAWRAVIQPKSKITMAMLLNGKIDKQGRCVNLSCSGRVSFTTTEATCICPVCGKHLSVLKEVVLPSGHENQTPNSSTIEKSLLDRSKTMDETSHSASDDDLASMGPEKPDQQEEKSNQEPSNTSDEDICAFKRVILQEANDDVLEPLYVPSFLDIRDSENVERFYITRFKDLQPSSCKVIARAFVELLGPRKELHHHIKGDEFPPLWWPKTSGENSVRYKGPDHLLKIECIRLLVHILRMAMEPPKRQHRSIRRSSPNIKKVEEAAMRALRSWFNEEDHPENAAKRPILKEIFRVAKAEERYKHGKIAGTTPVSVSIVMPSPPNGLIESDDKDAESIAAAYSNVEVDRRAIMATKIENLKEGDPIRPKCDRCRRLKFKCTKHLTACQACTKKHAKCSWKDATEKWDVPLKLRNPMTILQRRVINGALERAFEDWRLFADADAVEDYLCETGLSNTFLEYHRTEIFDTYLNIYAARETGG